MDNKNNELRMHKAADAIKWIVVFVLIFVIIGAVILLALQVGGVHDFFKKDDVSAEQTEDEESEGGLSLSPENIQDFSNGKAFALTASVMPIAATGNTYTLTVTTDTGEVVNLVWSVAWENPSSTWATGKNVSDYITLSTLSKSDMSETVTCLQPFGERAVVSVHADYDERVKASATFDYLCKYTFKKITCERKTDTTSTLRIEVAESVGTVRSHDLTFSMNWKGYLDQILDEKYQEGATSITEHSHGDDLELVVDDFPGKLTFSNGTESASKLSDGALVTYSPTWLTDYKSVEQAMWNMFIKMRTEDSPTLNEINAKFNKSFIPDSSKFGISIMSNSSSVSTSGVAKGFLYKLRVIVANVPTDGNDGTYFRTNYASTLTLNTTEANF